MRGMTTGADNAAGAYEKDEEWGAHFIAALGLELWLEDGITHGKAELRPEMWAPGTRMPRIGVLATMVDVVAGSLPTGPVNPTVDLRISLLSLPPSEGTVLMACRPLKLGRRLYVGETALHTGDPQRPFARALTTFMNEPIPGLVPFAHRASSPIAASSFDHLLDARVVAPGTVEMDGHPSVSNGFHGTIQGGAQSLLAEIAAEHALEPMGSFLPVDLDVRFINRMRTESAVATAEVLSGDLSGVRTRVPIAESGDGGRIVSLVSILWHTR